MVGVRLKHLVRDPGPDGVTRIYVRRPGTKKIRITIPETHPEFAAAYVAALKGESYTPQDAAPPKTPRIVSDTFRDLCKLYFASADFRTKLAERTRYVRRLRLEECCAEPLKPGGKILMGDCPFRRVTDVHVTMLRDRKAETPEAANDRLKALRTLFAWAKEAKKVAVNPAAEVKKLAGKAGGFAAWNEAQIAAFEARHPIGSKARLAFALLAYTGQRRSDVVRMGPAMVHDETMFFRQHKGRDRSPIDMALPIAPALREIIDASPTGRATFLETEFGKPFSDAGFGNWFRDRCDEAGVRGVAAHGLRKAFQAGGAEDGLTDRQLMALAGHRTSKETTRYTASAERRAMAKDGMERLGKSRLGSTKLSKSKKSPSQLDNSSGEDE